MAISASAVRDLRDQTGAGMMDCKKALEETGGDLAKAIEYLQIKGISKAAKKSGRVASEGLVEFVVSPDGKEGAIVETNCETDFVARNDDFRQFVTSVARLALDARIPSVEALLAAPYEGKTLDEVRLGMVGTIGENLTIRRAAYYHIGSPGLVAGYIHGEGKFGVLAAFSTSAETRDERLAELARDICLHICASAPVVVRDSELGEDAIERERRVFTEQAIESGKPREIAEKMVVGRLAKWKKEVCLVDQPFVKNPDLTIAAEIARVSKEIGVEIQIQAFTRFARGEGIEKEKTDFAAEVAAALQ